MYSQVKGDKKCSCYVAVVTLPRKVLVIKFCPLMDVCDRSNRSVLVGLDAVIYCIFP